MKFQQIILPLALIVGMLGITAVFAGVAIELWNEHSECAR